MTLHSDGSLTGCNGQIIERVDKGIAMLCCQLVCLCTGLIVHISVQNNLSAVALGTVYFDERCGRRHHNDSLCTEHFAAYATPCAWFPADAVISPFARSSSLKVLIL